MSQVGDALTGPGLDPPVKAIVCWNSNPAQVAPDQCKRARGPRAATTSSLVVLEQFMTDTALHADVVLPATTALEHLDLVFSWGHHYFTLSEPAIEPVGEAKPNTEAFRLIAARMGLDDPCFSETDEELLEALVGQGAAGRDAGSAALAGLREGRSRQGGRAARRRRVLVPRRPPAARRRVRGARRG